MATPTSLLTAACLLLSAIPAAAYQTDGSVLLDEEPGEVEGPLDATYPEDALVLDDMILEPGQVVLRDPGQGPPRGKAGLHAMIQYGTQYWPGGKLPVVFDPAIEPSQRELFFEACREWEAVARVRCVPRLRESGYLQVVVGEGCWSHVGYRRGFLWWWEERKLSLGEGCWTRGVILHELGHAFGFMHEQQRGDRDDYIRVLWDNIEPERHPQYQVVEGYTLGTPYDFESIMHYWRDEFAKEPGLPAFEGREGYEDQARWAGRRERLSESDAKAMSLVYGLPEARCP
ncbi:MAG: hypothetical protein HY554_05050 [Elusimicrobia bacterium]|nr:hypothetical protein [Elusimicrobiota bacterium]